MRVAWRLPGIVGKWAVVLEEGGDLVSFQMIGAGTEGPRALGSWCPHRREDFSLTSGSRGMTDRTPWRAWVLLCPCFLSAVIQGSIGPPGSRTGCALLGVLRAAVTPKRSLSGHIWSLWQPQL